LEESSGISTNQFIVAKRPNFGLPLLLGHPDLIEERRED
jgi:hypothetical protein